MKNINQKVLSTVIAVGAIASIPNAAKAQYYPTNPYNPSTTTYYPQSSYPSYEERIRASERRHQQQLDLIWGNY